jgi:hypothetical protein
MWRAAGERMPTVQQSLVPRMADHPRFLEIVAGRLLDLVVHTVEGIRQRVQRPTIH